MRKCVRGNNSPIPSRGVSPFRQYKYFSAFYDVRLGDITLLVEPNSRDRVARRERRTQSAAALNALGEASRRRAEIAHAHVVRLVDYAVEEQRSPCGVVWTVSEYYEYPSNDLQRCFEAEKTLSAIALTHILYQQLDAGAALEGGQLPFHRVTPAHITWSDSVSKLFLVFDPDANAKAAAATRRTALAQGEPLIASPAVLKGFEEIDIERENVFCLGLCLLQAGTGDSLANLYEKGDKFDNRVLNEMLDNFTRKFTAENHLLVSAVKAMVNLRQDQRPTCTELLELLPSYEEAIGFFAFRSLANAESSHFQTENRDSLSIPPAKREVTVFSSALLDTDFKGETLGEGFKAFEKLSNSGKERETPSFNRQNEDKVESVIYRKAPYSALDREREKSVRPRVHESKIASTKSEVFGESKLSPREATPLTADFFTKQYISLCSRRNRATFGLYCPDGLTSFKLEAAEAPNTDIRRTAPRYKNKV